MTSIKDEIVPKFRRAIGDIEEPYTYKDNYLVEYLADAIEQIKLEWNHNYVVDRNESKVEPDISPSHQMLFIMKAKLEMLNKRPDVSFSTGGLSVTRKSNNKKELIKKIDNILDTIIAVEYLGGTNTELDDYAKRLENWLYIQNL